MNYYYYRDYLSYREDIREINISSTRILIQLFNKQTLKQLERNYDYLMKNALILIAKCSLVERVKN